MQIRLLTLTFLISFTCLGFGGCGTTGAPDIAFCALYSSTNAECNPTDPEKENYEITTDEMLGFQCTSAEDFAEIKSYYKELQNELKQCYGRK